MAIPIEKKIGNIYYASCDSLQGSIFDLDQQWKENCAQLAKGILELPNVLKCERSLRIVCTIAARQDVGMQGRVSERVEPGSKSKFALVI